MYLCKCSCAIPSGIALLGGEEISWEAFAEVSLGLGAMPLFLGETVTGNDPNPGTTGDVWRRFFLLS